MKFDYENGYALVETKETVTRINDKKRSRGRVKVRYDIIKRDGQATVVLHNLTSKEVDEMRKEIERQNNKLW